MFISRRSNQLRVNETIACSILRKVLGLEFYKIRITLGLKPFKRHAFINYIREHSSQKIIFFDEASFEINN